MAALTALQEPLPTTVIFNVLYFSGLGLFEGEVR